MTTQEQDKLWYELSQLTRDLIIEKYDFLSTQSSSVLKAFKYALENTYGSHNLKSTLTYEEICKKLFKKGAWQFGDGYMNDEYGYFDENANETYPLNMTSQKQPEKLLAINKLLNVAKYLNGDWKPDWSNTNEKKWGFQLWDNNTRIDVVYFEMNDAPVYFRTAELAKQAAQILGEKTIKLALTTDY